MRPHLVVRFAPGARVPDRPHWHDVAQGRAPRVTTLERSLDALLARHGVPFLATREYLPHGGLDARWTDDELASGFDRVYRLVLLRGGSIPPGLVRDIRLLPIVERVRAGGVASAPLPSARALAAPTPGRWSRDAIGLPLAHATERGDPSVVVAVLDTGVCATHPELDGALLPGRDFVDVLGDAAGFVGDFLGVDERPDDEQGHGTHVSGIIAARGKRMPVGVAPRCKILPVRVLGTYVGPDGRQVGAGLRENIDHGLKWAIDRGAHVVNMSLGLLADDDHDMPHAEVIEYARRRGVTVVAAAGNDGTDQSYYPSALPHVLAVGAFGQDGNVARFSTRGRQVDVVAPGEDIYSSFADDDYAFSSGTSQASPFVTGTVALMKSLARRLGTDLADARIKHVLKRTADRIGTELKTRDAGYGRLNAADALRFLQLKTNRRFTKPARRAGAPTTLEARP